MIGTAISYLCLSLIFNDFGIELYKMTINISGIVATYALTLVSLLGGIVVIITSLKDSYYSRVFKSSGGYSDYMFIYFNTIISIFITHCMTIPAHVNFYWFKIMLSSMFFNTLQTLFLIISAFCLSSKNEESINN